jgi:hypothetical protein
MSQNVSSESDSDDDRLLLLAPPPEEITMAMFTTRIKKRYPSDEITMLDNPHQAVSFFSELKQMAGKEITHKWFYEGELKFEASFKVRADEWRIWSTQLLPEDLAGQWQVEVVDEDGEVLEIRKLDYVPGGVQLLAND